MYNTKPLIGMRRYAMRIFFLFTGLLVLMSSSFWPGGVLGSRTVAAYAADLTDSLAIPAYKSVGYYTSWGIYGRNYQVTDIDASKLTHLNYSFF
nr:hypothetical protein [Paenibacillus sp. E194]